jgi:hypothetical protein
MSGTTDALAAELRELGTDEDQAHADGRPQSDNPYDRGERNGTGITCPGGNLQKQRMRYWDKGWRLAETESREAAAAYNAPTTPPMRGVMRAECD